MNGTWIRKGFALGALAIVIGLAAGCAPSIDGKYSDSAGMVNVDIHGDKATFTSPVGNMETAVKRDGDKVTLTYEGQPVELTRTAEGNLDGGMLKLIKKK